MVSAVPLLCGLALLCWPAGRCAARLRSLVRSDDRPRRMPRPPRLVAFVVVLACGAIVSAFCGVAGGIAAALATGTVWRRLTARRATRAALFAIDGLTEAIRSMVAELRAGVHPASAADAAAVDARPSAAHAMRAIAAAARLDGDIERALAPTRAAAPAAAQALVQLSRAWILAQHHGLPLADVLDAVRADLESRVRFARQVQARMAGPRASAAILAVLPVAGIGLGEAMGARPLHVLTASGAGQILLLVGVGLVCAGVAWSARLTGQVVLG